MHLAGEEARTRHTPGIQVPCWVPRCARRRGRFFLTVAHLSSRVRADGLALS